MSFITPANNVKLPQQIVRLQDEYMCPTTNGNDFNVDLSTFGLLDMSVLSERLCSPQIFRDSIVHFIENESKGEIVHKRVILKTLPFKVMMEAGLKPVSHKVLTMLVLKVDLTKKDPNYPLAKASNANNHILLSCEQKSSLDVCTLTPLPTGKMSFVSPLNVRPISFAPGSVLLYTV